MRSSRAWTVAPKDEVRPRVCALTRPPSACALKSEICAMVTSHVCSSLLSAVFELNAHGDLVQFRYNNDDRAPLCHLSAHNVDAFYRHLPSLLSIVRSDAYVAGRL